MNLNPETFTTPRVRSHVLLALRPLTASTPPHRARRHMKLATSNHESREFSDLPAIPAMSRMRPTMSRTYNTRFEFGQRVHRTQLAGEAAQDLCEGRSQRQHAPTISDPDEIERAYYVPSPYRPRPQSAATPPRPRVIEPWERSQLTSATSSIVSEERSLSRSVSLEELSQLHYSVEHALAPRIRSYVWPDRSRSRFPGSERKPKQAPWRTSTPWLNSSVSLARVRSSSERLGLCSDPPAPREISRNALVR